MISMITKLLVGLTPLVLAGDADIFKGNDSNTIDQTYATKLEVKGETKVSKNTSEEDTVEITLEKTDGKTWYFTVSEDAVFDYYIVKGGNGYAKIDVDTKLLKGELYSVSTPDNLLNGGKKVPAISHLTFYGLKKAPVVTEEEKDYDYELTFKDGDVSHVTVIYINKTTGEMTPYEQYNIPDGQTNYGLIVKEGYVTAAYVKQAQTGVLWLSEEYENVDSIKEFILPLNNGNKGIMQSEVITGDTKYTLSYINGNSNQVKNCDYEFKKISE